MSTYLISSSRKPRGFTVQDPAGRMLAEMRQPRLLSQDMEGTVEGHAVRISAEGFWRMRYGVFVDEVKIGAIRTGGWGQLKLGMTLRDHAPVELEFAHVGNWRERYQLRLARNMPLLEVKPTSRWSWLTRDLAVEVIAQGIAPEQMPLMLAIIGFCARLKRARAHAAAAT